MRVQSRPSGVLFTVLLAFFFVFCALYTVLIGAQVYENIQNRGNRTFNEVTALAFVTNIIRKHDTSGAVAVRDFQGTNALVLTSVWDGEPYETLLYAHDGYIMELFCSPDASLSPEDGERVLPGRITFEDLGGSLVKIDTPDGSVCVFLRAGGSIYE